MLLRCGQTRPPVSACLRPSPPPLGYLARGSIVAGRIDVQLYDTGLSLNVGKGALFLKKWSFLELWSLSSHQY